MTRADRDKLAELLEAVAVELEAAEGKAKAAAEASCSTAEDPRHGYAYRVGHMDSCARAGARRIRSLVAEFLASRAKGKPA